MRTAGLASSTSGVAVVPFSEAASPPASMSASGSAIAGASTSVLAAGDASSPNAGAALEQLCRTYWYPLYAFVRREGYGPEDAKDLTQGFFARVLEKNYLAQVERQIIQNGNFYLVLTILQWNKDQIIELQLNIPAAAMIIIWSLLIV